MTDTGPKTDPDKSKILQLYAAFGAALLLSLVPSIMAAGASLLVFLGVLVAAYIFRTGAQDGSLLKNHMVFIIRTIWIGSFVAILTITAGSTYLFFQIDNAPLLPCFENFSDPALVFQIQDMEQLKTLFGACLEPYIKTNMRAFIFSGLITIVPALLYFIMRYLRGLTRALKARHVPRQNSWF